ncbi:MAG: hypothetical protein ACI9G1_002990 [Pirellulaceae bacterium]|jgi:hypothetical protein
MAFATNWTLGANATDVALADFDNDGDVAAFVTTNRGTPNCLWLNSAIDTEASADR